MLPRLSVALILIGIGLIGLGVYDYLSPAPGPALEAENADVELHELPVAAKTTVVFYLINHGSRPLDVINVGGC